jgi:hypothetical protein
MKYQTFENILIDRQVLTENNQLQLTVNDCLPDFPKLPDFPLEAA